MAVTRKRWSNTTWRVWFVVAMMGLGAVVITLRLAQLQIIDHAEYAREARLTHTSEVTLNDRRGALLDRSGYPLAASQTAYNVMVERDDWADPTRAAAAAQQLAEATGVPAQEMLDIVIHLFFTRSFKPVPAGNRREIFMNPSAFSISPFCLSGNTHF